MILSSIMHFFASVLCQFMPIYLIVKNTINYAMIDDKEFREKVKVLPFKMYLKKVENHTKNGKTKRVRFGVRDDDIFNETIVCVCSFKSFDALHNDMVEDKTKIKSLENDLKEAFEKDSSKSDDATNQLNNKHIEEINKLKEKHIEEIKRINESNKDDIKEYQSNYQKAMEQVERLMKEVNIAKAQAFDYANKYNQLRQEVINLSRWDVFRNRHIHIPNDYPPLQLSVDDVSIDVQSSDKQSD